MRVFVTGGTGYVGSAVVRRLASVGHEVVGLVRNAEKARVLEELGGTPVLGNLREPSGYVLVAAGCDAVIHIAAEPGPERLHVERGALEALLSAARSGDTPRVLVYTSVLFVLGDTGDDAASEDASTRPVAHAAGRAEHEEWILGAADGPLATAVIRPGMVFGGGEGGAVSELFRSATQDGAATYVGNGHNRWSLVHRDDVAELYCRVIEQRARGIFHAVDGHPLSVLEIARRASHAAGADGATRSIPLEEARRSLGAFADALCLDQVVDAPRAHALGWQPSWPAFGAAADAAFAEWKAHQGFAFSTRPS